jgi:hypothetical protein
VLAALLPVLRAARVEAFVPTDESTRLKGNHVLLATESLLRSGWVPRSYALREGNGDDY